MKEKNHFIDRIFIGLGKWIYKKLGITLTVIFSLTLLFSLISFIVYQISHKTYGFDLSDKNNIGDALGGLTAPFIGIMGVVLTFLAFYVQYDFNKKQMKIIGNQNELILFESFKEGLKYLFDEKVNFYSIKNNQEVYYQTTLEYHIKTYFFNITDISTEGKNYKTIINKENIYFENSNLLRDYFQRYFKIFDYVVKSEAIKSRYSANILKNTLINHFNTLDLFDQRIFILLLVINRQYHPILSLLVSYQSNFKELFNDAKIIEVPIDIILNANVSKVSVNVFFEKVRNIIDSTKDQDIYHYNDQY